MIFDVDDIALKIENIVFGFFTVQNSVINLFFGDLKKHPKKKYKLKIQHNKIQLE